MKVKYRYDNSLVGDARHCLAEVFAIPVEKLPFCMPVHSDYELVEGMDIDDLINEVLGHVSPDTLTDEEWEVISNAGLTDSLTSEQVEAIKEIYEKYCT